MLKAYQILLLGLTTALLTAPHPAASQSAILEFFTLNRRSCKTSITNVAQALLSPTFHKECLTAARRKIYRPQSTLSKQLSLYPRPLQKIFLESLNRRLDAGRTYKSTYHPTPILHKVVKDYFVDQRPLRTWHREEEALLKSLKDQRQETPSDQKIPFYSLNKYLKNRCGTSLSPTISKHIDQTYFLLSKLYIQGISISMKRLKRLTRTYAPDLVPALSAFDRQISDLLTGLTILYKAAYAPPNTQNKADLDRAIALLWGFQDLPMVLAQIEQRILNACLKDYHSTGTCAALSLQYEHLKTASDVIRILIGIIAQQCGYSSHQEGPPKQTQGHKPDFALEGQKCAQ